MKEMTQIPIENLWEVFDVDFSNGLLFWKKQLSSRAKIGALVGTGDKTGYQRTYIFKNRFLVHRIIWAMKHGAWPDGMIDHINGNKSDNRIENLRLATKSQNNVNNPKPQKNNKLGVRGVSFHKGTGKFIAQLRKDKKRINLGYFNTIEEASKAYIAASQQYHGEFSPYLEGGL